MLCSFVLNFACDKALADLSACLISICKARPWGRPGYLSHLGHVKVLLVAIHEVDEMVQMVITEVKTEKPPYIACSILIAVLGWYGMVVEGCVRWD